MPWQRSVRGKNRSSKTPKGNKWLKRALTEAAWAATLKKKSYLAALYHRLAPRRGKKRAIIALARTILQSAWHILKDAGCDDLQTLHLRANRSPRHTFTNGRWTYIIDQVDACEDEHKCGLLLRMLLRGKEYSSTRMQESKQ